MKFPYRDSTKGPMNNEKTEDLFSGGGMVRPM